MGLWRSGSVVAALLLLGRLTGFGREWLLSARAGASGSSDLAIVLLTLPDLLVNLLLGGGMGATLVPVLQQLPPAQRQRLAAQVALPVGGAFALLAGLLALGAPGLLELLAPGVPLAQRAAAQLPLGLALLAVPLTALAGVSTALLNASGRFGLGACGTALFNLLVIAALASRLPLVWAVAAGVLAGALLRLLVQLVGASSGPPSAGIWQGPWLVDLPLLRRFGGNFGFVTGLVLLPPIARAWASTADPGALSLFNYASKLVELPLGVLMGALSTVLLPHLAANPNAATIGKALRLSALAAVAISLPALLWATPLARLVYFKADFSALQLQQLGHATTWAFVFLLPQVLVTLYGTVFAALGRTRPLVLTAVVMVAALLAAAPLAARLGGLSGVMAAYGLVYALGAVLLSWLTWRALGAAPFRLALGLKPG
ncbi:MAG: hypothetical protein FJ051_07905 [Cyanobacteria bacterium M_surface_9_m1_291]|nr:hypothetical protein [Cyanobacteria bacterium M_surface_9_m1_291]